MAPSVTCPRCNGRRTAPLPRTPFAGWRPGDYYMPPFCRLCRGHGWVSWVREPKGQPMPIIVVR
jgi:hypothetical protein